MLILMMASHKEREYTMALTAHAALAKDTRVKHVEMQHRHFAFIAATIKAMRGNSGLTDDQIDIVALEFRRALKNTNKNFSGERFDAACT